MRRRVLGYLERSGGTFVDSCSQLAWGGAKDPSEVTRHMALVGEPRLRCQFRERNASREAVTNKRDPQLVHLGHLIEDLLTLVNYQVVVQKVTVQTRIPSHCNWQGLAGDLGRALLYILDNALEAMTEGLR